MSRCFPFPRPGYEKKGKTDDVDLLKKEKEQEKKHKKEKKDKEKREIKERREKEGKDGKHKEKKDKKEKHRDKKKDRDKEKDKDKNKNNTADGKGIPGQTGGLNAGKLIQKEIKQNDRKGILSKEKLPKHFADNNGEKIRETNNHLAEENKDSKFLQGSGRRIKEDDGGAFNQLGQDLGRRIKEDGRAGNQLFQKFTFASQEKDEGTARLVAKDSGTCHDGKEKIKDKSIDVKKIDGQGIRAEARPMENATVHNHAGNFHSRVCGTPRSLEKNFNRAVEATLGTRETSKEKKDDKPGDKRKDRDKEKKGHGKDKDGDKEKKKEEKLKEQTEHKNIEQNKFKVSNKGGPMSTNSFPQITNNSHENSVSGENLKKRKDMESNGILHASDSWPSKLPRPSSSPHPFTENGRIVKPCQSSIPYASDGPVATTNFKVNNKEHKKNGIIGAQPSADCPNKHLSAPVPADPAFEETSAKPPHPDSKYLSQVYSVPKMDERPDFDEEWLFGSHSLQEKRSMAEPSKIVGTGQVWAEALHIEPDIYALPYVIPY